ncbi:hypothetical protein [Kitasatospora sp. NPDC086791]|uniref:hypothetical protein n=1 Tax=Kitasatospora sp. NPDC086791 TaxID=3155178 RepID=UPI003415B809
MNLLALRSLVVQSLEKHAARPGGEVTGVEMSNPLGSHGPWALVVRTDDGRDFRLTFTEI